MINQWKNEHYLMYYQLKKILPIKQWHIINYNMHPNLK